MAGSVILTALFAWLGGTLVFSIAQAIENRRAKPGDVFWAPVWWVALTWPFWVVVLALDLRVQQPGAVGRRRRK